MNLISETASIDGSVSPQHVARAVSQAFPAEDYRNQRVLLIVPDGTRTAPVGLLFQSLHERIGGMTQRFDVLIALGTHPPMSETAICRRLEISEAEREGKYRRVRFFNHEWHNPAAL